MLIHLLEKWATRYLEIKKSVLNKSTKWSTQNLQAELPFLMLRLTWGSCILVIIHIRKPSEICYCRSQKKATNSFKIRYSKFSLQWGKVSLRKSKDTYFSLFTEGTFFHDGWRLSRFITWPFLWAKPNRQYMDTAFCRTHTQSKELLHETKVARQWTFCIQLNKCIVDTYLY